MRLSSAGWSLAASVYPEVPDGGWGWMVALAFFLVEVCTYGTLKSLGVFLEDLMEEFKESNSRVSWVVSICAFIFTFSAPLSTWLANRYGYRPVVMMGGFLMTLGTVTSAFVNSINELYVTVGVVSGFSYSLAFLPTLTLLSQYFSRRRALVTSMASSGESLAIFTFAPALSALKQHIGWRHCLLVLALVQSSVIGCGFLLRPIIIRTEAPGGGALKPKQSDYELENQQTKSSISSQDSGVTSLSASNIDLKSVEAEGKAALRVEDDRELCSPPGAVPQEPRPPKLLDLSVLKEASFLWYALFGLFATLGFFAPQLYVVELGKSRGLAPGVASSMLSVMAAAEVVGRLSVGLVLSRVTFRKTRMLLGWVLLLSVVLVAFALVWELWGLLLCSALYGYLMGSVGSTHIPLLAEEEVVGIHRMPTCVGVYVFIQSFAGLAGPPLSGLLVDVTQNYGAAFYSCAAGVAVSAVCLAMVGTCTRAGNVRGEGSHCSEQLDFLEVDVAPEDSPLNATKDRGGPA